MVRRFCITLEGEYVIPSGAVQGMFERLLLHAYEEQCLVVYLKLPATARSYKGHPLFTRAIDYLIVRVTPRGHRVRWYACIYPGICARID